MVRRLVSVAVVVAWLVGGAESSPAADKDLWGWLEQFSGPGPFKGNGSTSIGVVNFCQADADTERGLKLFSAFGHTARGGTPEGNAYCGWFDYRALTAPPGGGFNKVSAKLFDGGLSVSLQRAVSVGTGFGFIHFASGTDSGPITKTNRFVLTPIRITVSPAIVLAPFNISNSRLKDVLALPQFYGKVVCVPGNLNGASFGVVGHPYTSEGECVRSWGLQFNLLEVLRR